MIYSVSVYSKTGKLRKIISSETLTKRHWQIFKTIEEDRKSFVKDRATAECYRLLTNYRNINFICDNLHEDESWKTT